MATASGDQATRAARRERRARRSQRAEELAALVPGLTRSDAEWLLNPVFSSGAPPWVLVPNPADGDQESVRVFAVQPIKPATNANEEQWLIWCSLHLPPGGSPALRQVGIQHLWSDLEVTGTVIRGVSLAGIRKKALSLIRKRPVLLNLLVEAEWEIPADRLARARHLAERATDLPLKRGRAGYPDDHYRWVAFRCIHLQGATRRVLAGLVEEGSARYDRRVSYEAARDWVSGARARGFLAPTKQGRTDFRPGPNLVPHEPENQQAPRRRKGGKA